MNSNNEKISILHPISKKANRTSQATALVLPFFSEIIAEINERNHKREIDHHAAIKGLVADVNVLNEECQSAKKEAAAHETMWGKYRYDTHKPFISSAFFILITVGVFLGEWIMASLNLRGLGIEDSETYIAAFAIVGAGFMASKAISFELRKIPFEKGKELTMSKCMIALLAIMLVTMLVGMSCARASALQSSVDVGETHAVSTLALFGLGLLQFSLYALQVGVFFVYLPANPVAEKAKLSFQKSQKRLNQALHRRARVAAELDKKNNSFHAMCDQEIENGKRMLSQYIRAVHASGKTDLLPDTDNIAIKDEWFKRSPRIANTVDDRPLNFHKVVDVVLEDSKESSEIATPQNINLKSNS